MKILYCLSMTLLISCFVHGAAALKGRKGQKRGRDIARVTVGDMEELNKDVDEICESIRDMKRRQIQAEKKIAERDGAILLLTQKSNTLFAMMNNLSQMMAIQAMQANPLLRPSDTFSVGVRSSRQVSGRSRAVLPASSSSSAAASRSQSN